MACIEATGGHVEKKKVGFLEAIMRVVKELDEAWDEAMASQASEPKESEEECPKEDECKQ
jgi:flagellin-specific chaperone FliS